jgi:hypothetical protein
MVDNLRRYWGSNVAFRGICFFSKPFQTWAATLGFTGCEAGFRVLPSDCNQETETRGRVVDTRPRGHFS